MNNTLEHVRNIPAAEDIEFIFIGGLLKANDKYFDVCDIARPEYFYNPLNGVIYQQIGKLINSGKEASVFTLRDFVKSDVNFSSENEADEYLVALNAAHMASVSLVNGAEQIRVCYKRRKYLELGEELVQKAQVSSLTMPEEELDAFVQEEAFRISSIGENSRDIKDLNENLNIFLANLERGMKDREQGKTSSIKTGIPYLDTMIGGFSPGNMIVLGAGTRIGKSVFGLNIAMNAAKAGKRTLFYTLEMPILEVNARMMMMETGISTTKYKEYDISQTEFSQTMDAKRRVDALPLDLVDQPMTMAALKGKALRRRKTTGLDFMVVDYLQLIPSQSSRNTEDSLSKITEISRGLKRLALELQIPILALSQLSRAVDAREGHRPRLSDLRESGTIEQDSDIVLLLFREEEYLKYERPPTGTDKEMEWLKKLESVRGKAEIDVAKNRCGRTGIVRLRYEANRSRFLGE